MNLNQSQIVNGDSLDILKQLPDESVDLVCTDPPYGYSFMGKDWDKAVPSVEIWQECLRVLKPGAFCFVMSAPRSDVQNAMISRLMEAGFRLDFTPIYWTYASGFPKAGNIGKLVDNRNGIEREVVGQAKAGKTAMGQSSGWNDYANRTDLEVTKGNSELEGSYAGFQPKPAVEVIIVAMKPLSEKTYMDQALANGHGITWLDECRIPTDQNLNGGGYNTNGTSTKDLDNATSYATKVMDKEFVQPQGRFPANLLVSDDVLNDGTITKSGQNNVRQQEGKFVEHNLGGAGLAQKSHPDSGSYSRYFDLDKWSQTLPFLIVPKASKSEKNKGLNAPKDINKRPIGVAYNKDGGVHTDVKNGNHHPTVKPLKLMSYLIQLGSRETNVILDPFVGSGTTVIAASQLKRVGIGVERDPEYTEIAKARLAHSLDGQMELV